MDSTCLLLSVMIAYFKKNPRYIVVSPVHPTVCHVLLSQTALTLVGQKWCFRKLQFCPSGHIEAEKWFFSVFQNVNISWNNKTIYKNMIRIAILISNQVSDYFLWSHWLVCNKKMPNKKFPKIPLTI